MSAPIDPAHRTIAQNRKARHLYIVLDQLEVGIVLVGTEVKSLRAGQISLAEAYVLVRRDELWLVGAHIPEYAFGNKQNHAPTRDRKLLANRREIHKWYKAVREKGVTMIPLEVYFNGARVKLLVGLCRGKRVHDKRRSAKEREDRRDMDREMRRRR